MTSRNLVRLWTLAPTLVAFACAGSKLNDVGDLPGGTSGSGGASSNATAGKGGENPATAGSRASAGSRNDVAGAGGAPDVDQPPIEGGAGPDAFPLTCDGCEVVAEAPDIRAIAIGAEHVFWVEYGSSDDLGNYEGNGRLRMRAFDGEETVVIAPDLEAPVALKVTDTHAYVLVEQSSAATGAAQLVRVALDTGEAQTIQSITWDPPVLGSGKSPDWFRRFFTALDGATFWVNEGKLYRLDEDSFDGPSMLLELEQRTFYLTSDSSQLYIYDRNGIKSLLTSGGTPSLLREFETLGDSPRYFHLQVAAGFIYALDPPVDYLVRMPTTGGSWKRVTEAFLSSQLLVDGDQVFHDPLYWPTPDNPTGCSIQQGAFNPPSPAVELAIAPCFQRWAAEWSGWDVAPTSIYFGWDHQLYRMPRAER